MVNNFSSNPNVFANEGFSFVFVVINAQYVSPSLFYQKT